MAHQVRPPEHICCICKVSFPTQPDLTTHQAACLNSTPLLHLVAKVNNQPIPMPHAFGDTSVRKPLQSRRRVVAAIVEDQVKEQKRIGDAALSQSKKPVGSMPQSPPARNAASPKTSDQPSRAAALAPASLGCLAPIPTSHNTACSDDGDDGTPTMDSQKSVTVPYTPDSHSTFPTCNTCHRAFLTPDAIEHHWMVSPRHREERSKSIGQKPVRCKLCGGRKVYINQFALAQHVREMHADILQPKKLERPTYMSDSSSEPAAAMPEVMIPKVAPGAKVVKEAVQEKAIVETRTVVTKLAADTPDIGENINVPGPIADVKDTRNVSQTAAKVASKEVIEEAEVAKPQVAPPKSLGDLDPAAAPKGVIKEAEVGKPQVVPPKSLGGLNPTANPFKPRKDKFIRVINLSGELPSTSDSKPPTDAKVQQQISRCHGNDFPSRASASAKVHQKGSSQAPPDLSWKGLTERALMTVKLNSIQHSDAGSQRVIANSAKRRKLVSLAPAMARADMIPAHPSFVAPSGIGIVIQSPTQPAVDMKKELESMADEAPAMEDIFAPLVGLPHTPWQSISYLGNTWSIIPEDHGEAYLKVLDKLCHNSEELLRAAFTLVPYTDSIFKFMQKCLTCHHNYLAPECTMHPGSCSKRFNKAARRLERYFSCCDTVDQAKTKRKPGCLTLKSHSFEDFKELAENWAFAAAPPPEPGKQKRKAVVLDCEMSGSRFNRSELVLVTAVDFFTAEVLINSLVKPSTYIVDWRSEYSGVTEKMILNAIAKRDYLDGWLQARERLFTLIDTDTILMGHSLNNDLDQLRLIHFRVVDTCLTIPKLFGRKHSVKSLSYELLQKEVQTDGMHGHDCLEDTLASRELVIWCLKYSDRYASRKEQSSVEKAKHEEEVRARKEKEKLEEMKRVRREAEEALVEDIVNRCKWNAVQHRLLKELLDTGITLSQLKLDISGTEEAGVEK